MIRIRAAWKASWWIGLFLAIGGLVACGGGETTPQDTDEQVPGEAPAETATVPVDLCFPGQDRRLHVERSEIPPSDATEERIRAVLELLLAGPSNPVLRAPFPADVTLSAVYLDPEGRVIVDLARADGARPPAAGSSEEVLIVYSLVNSVLLNTPEASSVVLLWNTQQRTTFAGHLDTSRPLTANLSLVAQDG